MVVFSCYDFRLGAKQLFNRGEIVLTIQQFFASIQFSILVF